MVGSDQFGKGQLIHALGIDGSFPEPFLMIFLQFNLSSGQEGIGGPIGGKDKGGRFEVFTNDEADPVFGGFQEKLGVNRSREGGHNDGGDVFKGSGPSRLGRFATELTVTAGQGTGGSIDTHNVIGHGEGG